MIIILKCICLLLAIAYGFSNIGRIICKNKVYGITVWLMAIGVVGFIYLQFWM